MPGQASAGRTALQSASSSPCPPQAGSATPRPGPGMPASSPARPLGSPCGNDALSTTSYHRFHISTAQSRRLLRDVQRHQQLLPQAPEPTSPYCATDRLLFSARGQSLPQKLSAPAPYSYIGLDVQQLGSMPRRQPGPQKYASRKSLIPAAWAHMAQSPQQHTMSCVKEQKQALHVRMLFKCKCKKVLDKVLSTSSSCAHWRTLPVRASARTWPQSTVACLECTARAGATYACERVSVEVTTSSPSLFIRFFSCQTQTHIMRCPPRVSLAREPYA